MNILKTIQVYYHLVIYSFQFTGIRLFPLYIVPKVIQQRKEESLWEKSGISTEIEKFIGENLINKIGIAIVIIVRWR